MDEKNTVGEAKEQIENAKKETEQIAKAASKAASGNYVGALKDALKSDVVKKKIRRALITAAIKLLIPVLVVVVLASAVFGVFTNKKSAKTAMDHLIAKGCSVFLARIL